MEYSEKRSSLTSEGVPWEEQIQAFRAKWEIRNRNKEEEMQHKAKLTKVG
jgi:hypothetical protein